MQMWQWMSWTSPTALFFVVLFLFILGLVLGEIFFPTIKRRGFLPLATTRGDRFFISLLLVAFIHLIYLGLADGSVLWVTGLSVVVSAWVMKWG